LTPLRGCDRAATVDTSARRPVPSLLFLAFALVPLAVAVACSTSSPGSPAPTNVWQVVGDASTPFLLSSDGDGHAIGFLATRDSAANPVAVRGVGLVQGTSFATYEFDAQGRLERLAGPLGAIVLGNYTSTSVQADVILADGTHTTNAVAIDASDVAALTLAPPALPGQAGGSDDATASSQIVRRLAPLDFNVAEYQKNLASYASSAQDGITCAVGLLSKIPGPKPKFPVPAEANASACASIGLTGLSAVTSWPAFKYLDAAASNVACVAASTAVLASEGTALVVPFVTEGLVACTAAVAEDLELLRGPDKLMATDFQVTVTGTLVQDTASPVVVTLTATAKTQEIHTAQVDLTPIGGPFNQFLTLANGSGQWSGTLTPPEAGLRTLNLLIDGMAVGYSGFATVAPLRADYAPVVTLSAQPSSAAPGEAVTITANVRGGTRPYHTGWRINGAPSSNPDAFSITDHPTTTTTYAITVQDSAPAIRGVAAEAVTVPVCAGGACEAGACASDCEGAGDGGGLADGPSSDAPAGDASPDAGPRLATALAVGSAGVFVVRNGGVDAWTSQLAGASGVPVAGLPAPIVSVSAGTGTQCALTATGAAFCWGGNEDYQLGNGSSVQSSATAVAATGLASGVQSIAVGETTACAVTGTGAVDCWGNNFDAILGNASQDDSDVPEAVAGFSGPAIAVSVYESACAVLASGGVACWGDNQFKILGTGPNSNVTFASHPVAVAGLSSGVVAISLGLAQACALTSTGSVMCWANLTGANSGVPTAVTGFTGPVTSIAVGDFSCATVAGGTVECWSANNAALTTTPSPVAGLSGPAAAIAVDAQACALLVDGSVECWMPGSPPAALTP
jgi:hypothetical protein